MTNHLATMTREALATHALDMARRNGLDLRRMAVSLAERCCDETTCTDLGDMVPEAAFAAVLPYADASALADAIYAHNPPCRAVFDEDAYYAAHSLWEKCRADKGAATDKARKALFDDCVAEHFRRHYWVQAGVVEVPALAEAAKRFRNKYAKAWAQAYQRSQSMPTLTALRGIAAR